ncbi:hypothetical protein MMC14_004131 [Varicellaria rhodocarpa]|nr:hypothetical protein [Varicellaria rhodocarpa]
MSASTPFFDAVKTRRSVYSIAPESTISDERIKEIVETAFLHCPSPFNTQSTRGLILLGQEHEKLWDIALEAAGAVIPPERLPFIASRVKRFREGYGTVLFFDDHTTFQETAEIVGPATWPMVKDQMPELWTALSLENFGCSLQHYSSFIGNRVHATWHVPMNWTLKAQLVFGKAIGGPDREKTFKEVGERVLVRGGAGGN